MTLNELADYQGLASEAVLNEEVETEEEREELLAAMRSRLLEMRDAVRRGLESDAPSRTGMVGWNAKTLWEAPDTLSSPLLKRVQAYAMAVNEENARMGRIVAAPTAGSAGTLPGALLGVADHLEKDDDALLMPLVLAAGVGQVISKTMFIAGSTGGCGAEIGSSAAMAAAAVCELLGGDAKALSSRRDDGFDEHHRPGVRPRRRLRRGALRLAQRLFTAFTRSPRRSSRLRGSSRSSPPTR